MKNYYLFFAVAMLFSSSSCKISAPAFKTVENFKLEKVEKQEVKVGCEAVFYNPNKIKVTIKDIAVDVLLNNEVIGTLGEKADVVINKRSDFKIPLGISLSAQALITNSLQNLIGIFTNKEIVLTLQGNIKVKAFGIAIPIPLHSEQKIKLSDLQK
jgi:LEA14-like dessication related protein